METLIVFEDSGKLKASAPICVSTRTCNESAGDIAERINEMLKIAAAEERNREKQPKRQE